MRVLNLKLIIFLETNWCDVYFVSDSENLYLISDFIH